MAKQAIAYLGCLIVFIVKARPFVHKLVLTPPSTV